VTNANNKPAPTAPTKGVAVTHGWRWYRVEGNRLLSPLVWLFRHNFELPRDGAMDNVFFLPEAQAMWWTQVRMLHRNEYPFALTFGRVDPPFEPDPTMAELHSMKCAHYQALAIVTFEPLNLLGHYDLPIIENDRKPASLLAIQEYFGARPAPLHVTFICTFNVARSPMAESMFRQQLCARGLGDKVRVSSAGTNVWQTGGMDSRAAVELIAHSYPTKHEPTQLTAEHLNADLLVAMEGRHAERLRELGVPRERIRLLDVANPLRDEDFEPTYKVISAALPGLHEWVDQQLNMEGVGTHGYSDAPTG